MATCLMVTVATYFFAIGEDSWERPVTAPAADASYYYVYLPSLIVDRDLDFSNQYAVTGNWYQFGPASSGKPSNVFGIGPAIFQMPAFLVGRGIALATGDREDGFSDYEQWLALWTSIPFTIGALLVSIRLARRRVGDGAAAVLGPLLALFSGSLCYYALRQPGYAHPYASFFGALLVERWDASYVKPGPRSLRVWLFLGASFGAAMLARPQLALWAFLPALAAIDDLRRRDAAPLRRIFARWLAAGAVALVVFLPQLLAWKAVYGAFYVVPQGAGFMRWDEPAWLETLFASRGGLLPWAPLYLPMLLGLATLKDARRRLGIALTIGLLAQAFVNGAVWDWWGGGAFGGRRFDSAFIVFALGGAALLQRILGALRAAFPLRRDVRPRRWRRRIAAAAAALAVFAAVEVCVAQLELTAATSVVTVPKYGGRPVWERYIRDVGGIDGFVASQVSLASNVVNRLVFALHDDVGWYAYDRLVGVHHLGETFPGLNAGKDKLVDRIVLRDLGEPRFRGLKAAKDGRATTTAAHVRIFVGLNRPTPVTATFRIETSGKIAVWWNDEKPVERMVTGEDLVTLTLARPNRGPNWVNLRAPVGATITEPALSTVSVLRVR